MEFAENMSPLGNASAEDCADYVLTLFSDLTRKVTMQNLYHDGDVYKRQDRQHVGHGDLLHLPRALHGAADRRTEHSVPSD